MPYIGVKPEDIISTKIDTTTGTFSGNVTSGGTLAVTGASILNGGIDVAGDFNFDIGGGDLTFKDDGTSVVNFGLELGNFIVNAPTSNTDIIFKGNDGGSAITALTLDMSDAGTAIFHHDVKLADNNKIKLGASSDLEIYHDGSNSYIADEGTGGIIMSGGTLIFQNQARDETHATMTVNGAVELYHNNVKKFETSSSGVTVTGDITVGDGHTIADDGSDNLEIKSSSGENIVYDSANGSHIFKKNGTESFRIDDNNKVGIGTSSPNELLHVNGASTSALQLTTNSYTNGTVFKVQGDGASYIYNTENAMLRFGTNNLERIRITSAGLVTVNNNITAEGGDCLFRNSSGNSILSIIANASNSSILKLGDTADFDVGQIEYNHGSNYLAIKTNDSERMRIDSSGRVGIGTSSPSTTFQVGNGSASTRSLFNPNDAFAIGVRNGSDHGGFIGSGGANIMRFSAPSGAERMRIDSSGVTVTGNIANASGDFTLDVAGTISLDTDSGGIYFKDGGTTIGEFINSSSDFMLKSAVQDKDILLKGNDGGSTITALLLDMSANGNATFSGSIFSGGNVVVPNGNGIDFSATSDAAGGMASELLDDYEIGTYTPVLTGGTSGSLNLGDSATKLKYVKIGKSVTISGQLHIVSGSYSGSLIISVPFSSGDSTDLAERASGSVTFDSSSGGVQFPSNTVHVNTFIATNTTGMFLRATISGAGASNLNSSHIGSNHRMTIGITYQTT